MIDRRDVAPPLLGVDQCARGARERAQLSWWSAWIRRDEESFFRNPLIMTVRSIDWLIDWVVDMRVDVTSAPEVYVKHAMHQLYVNLCHRTVWYEFNWSDQESEWHEGDMMKKIDVSEEEMCWFLWIQSETWLVILTLCEIMCDKQCSEKIKRNAW